ncbi:hypothetical protein QYE76_008366 [Lolium multiflorum]|uniref:Glycosyltransferase 61 catalytic domain-containing protein n=1 Tax=Lolium multiflorum TaxID=4521 RepID=A0AAD8QEK6_LOLMU|nr:hypothetical protein QYE76_008366 [Lolium multiflorum]
MKARRNESSKKPRCGGAVAAWLLVPLLVLVLLKTDCLLQVTPRLDCERVRQGQQLVDVAKLKDADPTPKTPDSATEAPRSHALSDEIAGHSIDAIKDLKHEKDSLAMKAAIDGSLRSSDVAAPRSKLSCNFSSKRMNTCAMEGDVRMHGKSGSFYVVAVSDDSYRPENGTVVIRPYPRKWEKWSMLTVREVTIHSGAAAAAPPRCTVRHDVPVVVFSTGAYSRNFFHSMTDIVIPLFNTAREYDGQVQLVATDYKHKWITQFRHILAALSVYPVIDFDADETVRCFPSARVGVEGHAELRIIPALSRKGYTMTDFRDFLRSAYSLKRAWTTPANRSSGQRPRLVMVLRRKSRSLTNEAEAIATATEVGFEVVAAGPEMVANMAEFAEVVSSCDVMVGVHGAGLTNMVFLPNNGTVMQIIPWGGLRWNCFTELGLPVPEMGIRYVEYEATAEETTLKDVYPRDHVVFTDPLAIHKKGFDPVYEIFLEGQNVTLDIDRFRGTMQQIYQSVTIA